MSKSSDPHAWLDPIIEQQAKHYGLTVEQKASLFDGAAKYDESMLESGDDR
jgi:hypothetical protein